MPRAAVAAKVGVFGDVSLAIGTGHMSHLEEPMESALYRNRAGAATEMALV